MATTTQASFDAKKSINAGYLKKKRPPSAGIGRKPGVKNIVTQNVREMFAQFVHNNAANVQVLFDRVAKRDPAKALTIYHNMADFVIPRLARTEVIPSGDPLVSLNPITDAAQAAATYASILGNTKFNLSVITFAPPHQTPESVVAEQGQIPSRPPDNVVGIFERLGKE
jgi:hypothetical protein